MEEQSKTEVGVDEQGSDYEENAVIIKWNVLVEAID